MKVSVRCKLVATLACLCTLPAGEALAQPGRDGEAELARAVAGRTAGKPVNCIRLGSARSSRTIARTAIIYDAGRTLYVNRPRSGATSLGSDDILVTRTTGSQLCSLDTVRLLDRGSRFPKGFVSLGKFVPYTRAGR